MAGARRTVAILCQAGTTDFDMWAAGMNGLLILVLSSLGNHMQWPCGG